MKKAYKWSFEGNGHIHVVTDISFSYNANLFTCTVIGSISYHQGHPIFYPIENPYEIKYSLQPIKLFEIVGKELDSIPSNLLQ